MDIVEVLGIEIINLINSRRKHIHPVYNARAHHFFLLNTNYDNLYTSRPHYQIMRL